VFGEKNILSYTFFHDVLFSMLLYVTGLFGTEEFENKGIVGTAGTEDE